MRLKRLMSIVLAVALVMSFAMSASAGELYLEENFNYADTDAWKSAVATTAIEGNATKFSYENLDTFRATGKTNFATVTWLFTSGHPSYPGQEWSLATNANGDKYPLSTVNSNSAYAFIASKDWDAKNNTDEMLVISFDVIPSEAGAKNYFWSNAIAYTGNAETPAYIAASNGTNNANGTVGTYSEFQRDEFTTTEGEISRIAYIFKYDATAGKIGYKTSINAGEKVSSAFNNNNTKFDYTTKISGMHFNYISSAPAIADFKMYTIDNDGFNVTADIDGQTRVAADKGSATITFSHPVYEATAANAVYTLKTGDATVDTLTAGDITTSTVNGSYVSTVDVTLPALEEGTDYEIVVSGVTNELGDTLADSTISFSTPKPDITTSATITGATVGSMSEASVAVSNNTVSDTKAVSVIYAVYTDAGKLVDVVYAKDTVEAGKTATISAGIKLGTDAAKAKVMVWDGLSTVNPWDGFTSVDVAQ